MTRKPIDRAAPVQRALILHPAHARESAARAAGARLEEAAALALALDLEVVTKAVAPLRTKTPATLFGSGKVEEFRLLCEADKIDVAIVDDALTPVQQRNLEKAWQVKVMDRTGLILEIFARRAQTKEGRLQVELARLDYERSRLVRTWTHLERQRGGAGVMGGPGETQIETDRRLIADKIVKLKKELDEVRRTRSLQRQARGRVPYPTVALVGYTNAGKSTLFNKLTNAKVLAKDMLFATLDPTARTLNLPGGRPAIISDTVGFISDLPHELVEAFRATLEALTEADVILHVRDVATDDSEAQALDVRAVLKDVGVDPDSEHVLEVWNKIDQLDEETAEATKIRAIRSGASPVSAVTGEGTAALLNRIANLADEGPEMTLRLDAANGEALAWIYRNGRVVDRHEVDGIVTVVARMDSQAYGRFERQFGAALLADQSS
ncbi:MAG: GTPase HflX [Caulobacteraceae bacterium]